MSLIVCFHIDTKYMTTILGANQLHLEQFATNIGLKTLCYSGPKLWNNIFLSFTYVNCVHVFKARYKGMLLNSNLLKENTTSSI